MASAAALLGGAFARTQRRQVMLFDPSVGMTLQAAQRHAGIPNANVFTELPGLLIFDAVTQEEHGGESLITSHPVETGADVTDHSRPQPRTVSLVGVVSNRPIVPLYVQGLYTTRAEDAHLTVEGWRQTGTLLTLSTSLETYENMMIRSVSVPRSSSMGNVVQMAIDFQEIFTASTELVAAPVTTTTRAQPRKATATKPKKAVSTEAGSGPGGSALSILLGT